MSNGSKWCVLRTSGARTLPLVRSLNAAGLEAWAPVETKRFRVPRTSRYVEREAPMLPTYVFARADRKADLLRASIDPGTQHPRFGLMRDHGDTVEIPDTGIASLRMHEERAQRMTLKSRRYSFEKGARVTMREGAYAGLGGIVDGGNGKVLRVTLSNGREVKIEAFLLHADDVTKQEHRPIGRAALAA